MRAFRYLEVKSDFKCIVDETTKQSCGTEGPRAGTICLRVDSDPNYPVLGRVDSQSPCNELSQCVCRVKTAACKFATEHCQMIMVSTASVEISCALTLV